MKIVLLKIKIGLITLKKLKTALCAGGPIIDRSWAKLLIIIMGSSDLRTCKPRVFDGKRQPFTFHTHT